MVTMRVFQGIVAVSGSFLGLILGGVLALIEWRLVFLLVSIARHVARLDSSTGFDSAASAQGLTAPEALGAYGRSLRRPRHTVLRGPHLVPGESTTVMLISLVWLAIADAAAATGLAAYLALSPFYLDI